MTTPDTITDILRDSSLQWTEAEIVQWVHNQPKDRRQRIIREMQGMRAYGKSDHEIYLLLHEARRLAEEEGLMRPSRGGGLIDGIYGLITYWQQLKSETHIGDAMENLANLDMDKFGK